MSIARRAVFLIFLGIVILLFLPIQLRAPLGSAPVLGMSMYPTLHPGTLVFVRQSSNYQKGDIIAFYDKANSKIVLHRIVSIQGMKFITRGDNNEVIDDYSPTKADIYGKMYWDIPQVGSAAANIRTPLGISICAFLLLIAGYVSWRKSQKPQIIE